MILRKHKLMQSIIAVLLSANSAYSQYNVDHLVGNFEDNPTNKSVVGVGNSQFISVGTVTTSLIGEGTHKDIMLTKTDATGNVIWNFRYGQPDQGETGHAITLSWDSQHVIVVGSVYYSGTAAGNEIVPVRDAITMKVRISDGVLIWTTKHGVDAYDEEAYLIERTNDGIIGDQTYVVVGRSSGDPVQSYSRMYAFKMNDNGGEVWSRRYALSDNFPIIAMNPTSMVTNGFGRLMIAGIRSEVNRPTRIFTTGISTLDGSVVDDLLIYSNTDIYNIKDCSITYDAYANGYGIAFTADNFYGDCISSTDPPVSSSADRIGIMSLNQYRKVLWTNLYENPFATNQRAVDIDVKGNVYNIATTFSMNSGNVDRPGFLRINKAAGTVIDCHIYYSSQYNALSVRSNCMIQANNGVFNGGYLLKSFISPSNGFSLIKLTDFGVSACDQLVQISKCSTSTSGTVVKSEAYLYGSGSINYGPRHSIALTSLGCLSPIGEQLLEPSEPTTTDKMIIFPSPAGDNDDFVSIKFTSKLNGLANVHVYNSVGVEVLNYNITLTEGENTSRFNASTLSPGMHTVVIDTDLEIIDRGKLMKE